MTRWWARAHRDGDEDGVDQSQGQGWTKSRQGVVSPWCTIGPRTWRTRIDIWGVMYWLRDLGELGGFGLKTTGKVVSRFGPKNWGGSQGGMWHHRRACVEVKRLYEGPVVVRCFEPPMAGSFMYKCRGNHRMCNSLVNKRSGCSRQPPLPLLSCTG